MRVGDVDFMVHASCSDDGGIGKIVDAAFGVGLALLVRILDEHVEQLDDSFWIFAVLADNNNGADARADLNRCEAAVFVVQRVITPLLAEGNTVVEIERSSHVADDNAALAGDSILKELLLRLRAVFLVEKTGRILVMQCGKCRLHFRLNEAVDQFSVLLQPCGDKAALGVDEILHGQHVADFLRGAEADCAGAAHVILLERCSNVPDICHALRLRKAEFLQPVRPDGNHAALVQIIRRLHKAVQTAILRHIGCHNAAVGVHQLFEVVRGVLLKDVRHIREHVGLKQFLIGCVADAGKVGELACGDSKVDFSWHVLKIGRNARVLYVDALAVPERFPRVIVQRDPLRAGGRQRLGDDCRQRDRRVIPAEGIDGFVLYRSLGGLGVSSRGLFCLRGFRLCRRIFRRRLCRAAVNTQQDTYAQKCCNQFFHKLCFSFSFFRYHLHLPFKRALA